MGNAVILDSGKNAIDSLVDGYSWKPGPYTPANITYSFMTRLPVNAWYEDGIGFAPMTPGQMQATRDALAKWASVANLTFVEVSDSVGGQIQFGTNNQFNQSSGYAATAFNYSTITNSWIYLNNQDPPNFNYAQGTYGPMVILHEIGHALGLKHPGNYNAGSSDLPSGPFLPTETDNTDYSVLSYNEGRASIAMDRYPSAPMLYDIQAIQYLYGANLNYRTGNDTYRFSENSIPQCIWDAGGVNTFDFSQSRGATVINLNQGSFSSTAKNLGNVSIAYGAVIQNAIGSSGDDTIFCNTADNNIQCGSGNDTVYLSGGNDVVSGGLGMDTAVFSGSRSAYTITSSVNGHTVKENGGTNATYFLSGIESLKFSDASIASNAPPVLAQPLQDQDIWAGTAFRFAVPSATFIDGDAGEVLSYKATLTDGRALPAWITFDPSTKSFSGVPTFGDLGSISLRMTVVDAGNAAIHDDFVINVYAKGASLHGGPGSETFHAGAGNDVIDGGSGIDAVVYGGIRASFVITQAAGITTIKDTIGNGGMDSLANVERVRFADKALGFDTDGAAGQAYRLYKAAFDRAPDLPGLGWQIKHIDMGMDLLQLSSNFMASPEFSALYGTQLSNAGLVTQLYKNVLHRAPEEAGFDFWMDILGTGKQARHEVLMNFSESIENKAQVIGSIQNGIDHIYFA